MATCQACGKVVGCGCQLKTNSQGKAVCPECFALDNNQNNVTVIANKETTPPQNPMGANPFKIIISKVTGTITRNS